LGTCLERYAERSAEAESLRVALGECDRKGAADSLRADTLAQANGRLMLALGESDSLRRVEIARPRPCRVNLLIAHPSCGSMIGGAFLSGGILGFVLRK
jgi:hypothetical protein